MSEIEKSLNLTRRSFIAVSSAAIAVPVLAKMPGMVPDAKGAEKTYSFIGKKNCDLVALGGGGSGLVAAVRTAQLTGRKVIVLEKTALAGGGAQHANTIRTFRSKWQADRNLPDTTAEYARDMMDSVYWKLDAELVANALLGTGQFFDWMCEQGNVSGDRFEVGKYMFEIKSGPLGPQFKEDFNKADDGIGPFVMKIMKEKCKTYGVEVLTKHPAVDIETANGKIVAVVAKSEAGYIRVDCKACILATGSWINNDEILKKVYPKFIDIKKYMNTNNAHMNPAYTGDGIPLAEKAGAFIDYNNFCLRMMGAMHSSRNKVFMSMSQSPFIITVNLNGKRYCAEPMTSHMKYFDDGYVQLEQPRGQSFTIFDENALMATSKLPKRASETGALLGIMGDVNLPGTIEEINNSLKEAFAQKDAGVFKADTLEDLADQIGVNKENFLKTVKKYNKNCEQGIDLDFFKSKDTLVPISKPPYYALKLTMSTDGAFGGVQVNPEMLAYRPGGGIIEGFYATGDIVSSRFISMAGVKQQVLNDVSWAWSSGFLAGTNVAKYLKGLG